MTELDVRTEEDPPNPDPIPCAKCGSTTHITGNHNTGSPEPLIMTTGDGNHNSGSPAPTLILGLGDGNHNSGSPAALLSTEAETESGDGNHNTGGSPTGSGDPETDPNGNHNTGATQP